MANYYNCTFNIQYFYSDGEIENQIKEQSNSISSVLQSEKALQLWAIAQKNGWIDENLQKVKEISWDKISLFANEFYGALGFNTVSWAPFEQLWKHKHLSSHFLRAYSNPNLQGFIDTLRKALSEQ